MDRSRAPGRPRTLAFAGLPQEALLIERTLRARYDGTRRNPWNEIECGNHYARSLASWALLLAFTGVQWDGPARTLAVDPPTERVSGLFTTGHAWGRIEVDGNKLTLHVDGGVLDADRLVLRGADVAHRIRIVAGESRTVGTTTQKQTAKETA